VAKDLTINTGKSVTINEAKSLTVSGTLTNSAGSTGLVINSDATGTGSLIYTSGSAAATVNRYVSGNPEAWHLFSSPVDAQAISGDFTPTGTYPDLSGYDLFAWDEPTATWVNRKNTIATPIGTGLRFDDVSVNNGLNFMAGKGYLAEYQAANPTKQFQGTLNAGTVSYTLTNSGSGTYKAYNLVGNPYPSAIDWKASLGWTREFVVTNVGSGKDMSIWNDAGSGNYGTYSSASLTDDGTNGATRYIPVGQGFMVEATSPAGAFEMNNDVRVHQNPSFLKASGEIPNILRLKVSGNTNTYSDEIVVEFGHQTAEGGAEKMFSFYETAPSLYTVKPTGNYSIDFRGEPGAVTIPMSFKAGADGNYTIHASQIETFTTSSSIILEDLKLAKTQNLMTNPDYTFTAVKGEDASRFLLHFGGTFSVCDKETVKTFSISSSDNTIYVSNISGKTLKGEVIVYNMIGQPIMHQLLGETPVTRISLNAPIGYYLVKVVTSDHVYSTKVFINN
ncbi:MAG: T9SS type A sorting domain-containing protein, partial [Bacteroidetes bacterium]|nr:T9SS type A sorting domain-containing protein [Bacteroidota bacterium]